MAIWNKACGLISQGVVKMGKKRQETCATVKKFREQTHKTLIGLPSEAKTSYRAFQDSKGVYLKRHITETSNKPSIQLLGLVLIPFGVGEVGNKYMRGNREEKEKKERRLKKQETREYLATQINEVKHQNMVVIDMLTDLHHLLKAATAQPTAPAASAAQLKPTAPAASAAQLTANAASSAQFNAPDASAPNLTAQDASAPKLISPAASAAKPTAPDADA